MKFYFSCFLLVLAQSASTAEGFAIKNIPSLTTTAFASSKTTNVAKSFAPVGVVLNERRNDDDEYDDWYEDFDPSDYESQGRNNNNNGYDGGNNRNRIRDHDYVRDIDADNSNVDLDQVNFLISERLSFRKTGRFQEADALRDELLEKHGVIVYDKDKTWRTGASRSGSGSKWAKNKTRGQGRESSFERSSFRAREFGENGHDYELASDAGSNASSYSEEEIHQLLAERLQCKLNKRYRDADAIQFQLNEAGVYVNDGNKLWRADGQPFEAYSPRRYKQSEFSLDTDYASEIQDLVNRRAKAKSERLFSQADELRDELRDQYNVVVDDRNQQWSVGGDFGRGAPTLREPRNARSTTFTPYSMSPDSERPEDADEIQRLVELRETARSDRDFATADQIRDDLLARNVVINDRFRQWSVGGGFRRPSRPLLQYTLAPGSEQPEPEEFEEIQSMVNARNQARANKDYDEADRVLDMLLKRSVAVNDKIRQWAFGNPTFFTESSDYNAKGKNKLSFKQRGGGKLSEDDEKLVLSLLNERDECKQNRQFKSADRIRDRLKEEFQVGVDDRNRAWFVMDGGYVMSPSSTPLDDSTMEYVQKRVDDRSEARRANEFTAADDIRDELLRDYNVVIDDRTKEWRVQSQAQNAETESDAVKESSDELIVSTDLSAQTTITYDDLSLLTIPVLKEKLREAGLPVSGNKSELIERLMA